MAQARPDRVDHCGRPGNADEQGGEELLTTLHPALAELFHDLEDASLRWLLLRVPSNPAAPTGDVDLLVDHADLPRLRPILDRHGFVAVPGWQRPPTLLFVTVHEATGTCLLLDVTDEVSFGPGLVFRTDAAQELLAGSSVRDGMRLPADGDAFWALLLHCLLDKGTVPLHYRERLQRGAATATTGGRLAGALGPRAVGLRAAAERADWSALEAAGPELAAAWRARMSRSARLRPVTAEVTRLLRAPALLRRRYGVSLALLGSNGAGKSTLTAGLAESWPFPVQEVYMGLWKSGASAGSEVPVLSQLLRAPIAWKRYADGVLGQLRGHVVVFDRYATDARRPPAPPYAWLKRPYLWVLARCVPPPDLLLLLDLPGEVSYARKQENSLAETVQERDEYLAIARDLPRVHVIDANRAPDEVRADVLGLLWQRTRRRWRTAAGPG